MSSHLRSPSTAVSSVTRALAAVAAASTPDPGAYGVLIQWCADSNLSLQGRQLHARLILSGVNPGNFLASKLLTFYSRSGYLTEARAVFDAVPNKNLFTWNSMLLAYSLKNLPSSALRLFSQLPPSLVPDSFTASALLHSLSSSPKQAHAFALRRGFVSDLFVANALIALYAKTVDLDSARLLFDEMPDRDIVSWNSILSGYSHAGHYGLCLQVYIEMERCGVPPNGVTVASVLQACSQLKDLMFGMDVHQAAIENGIDMDPVVWNSVIGFYAKCGSLDYARTVFEEMAEEKDGVSYGAMISGYMSYGFVDRAMELFRQMASPVLTVWNAVIAGLVHNNRHSEVVEYFREMQCSGSRPNSVTLSSVMPTLSFFSNLSGGKQVHSYAVRNDFDQNVYIATALIDLYAKAGFLNGAQRVFDGAGFRSAVIWTAIISGYASHGDVNATLSLFRRMLNSGTRPDPVTFTAVLSACAHAGVVGEARCIFGAMLSDYGISPSIEHYACMVGVFSRSGNLKEAVEFIRTMPFEPTAKVWGQLLNGAAVFGNVELGRFVFDHLFKIEPENTGNYIVMANLYSRAGRWEEAQMVRDKMKGTGLCKIPGCSWTETSNGLQVFVARDTSHMCSKELYTTLEGLVGLMREEGYIFIDELDEESATLAQTC